MVDDRELMIEQIINDFNFLKVHVAMTALDWKWVTSDHKSMELPSIPRLKAVARQLLIKSINDKYIYSGGFEAKYFPKVDEYPEYFTLKFILAELDSSDD